MRRTNKIIITVVMISVILLGIGYAAIQNITLNIAGTAISNPSQANFTVRFSGTPTVSDESKVTARITDDTNATINVEGLTAKGDIETATYTVQNISADLSANLSVETTNNNEEYFTIESELAKTSLVAGETTTLTVTVELIKTPITETETATIGIQLTAEPVQPGEEGGTSGGTGGSSGSTETTPYLPTGFSQVEGTTLATGLTIQDSLGNQYVWVEVPRTAEVYPTAGLEITEFTETELNTIETDLHTYTSTYRNSTTYTDTWYSSEQHGFASADDYNALKCKMLKSVYQNGGFYVGKYETGIADSEPDVIDTTVEARTASGDATQTPVIQANAYPYNFVTCSQAQSLASGMASGEYTSSLMFGVQWDLVLKYLETKAVEQGTSQATIISALNTNSKSWGNYYDSTYNITNTSAKNYVIAWTDGIYNKTTSGHVILSTGAIDTFSKQGIYDLAGNVYEWTLEYTSNENGPCARRGGVYSYGGSDSPASHRYNNDTTEARSGIGFRITLY